MKLLTTMAVLVIAFSGTALAQCTGGKCEANGKCAARGATMSSMHTLSKNQLAQLVKNGGATIYDARGTAQFTAGHIDGAQVYDAQKLPADKNAKLVFYCGGGKCKAYANAAKEALSMGYKHVYVYKGGWAEWSQKS